MGPDEASSSTVVVILVLRGNWHFALAGTTIALVIAVDTKAMLLDIVGISILGGGVG